MSQPSAPPPPSYSDAMGDQKYGMGQPTSYGQPAGYGQQGYPQPATYVAPQDSGIANQGYQGFSSAASAMPGYAPPPQETNTYGMTSQPTSDWANASPSSRVDDSDEPVVWDTGSFSNKAIRRGFIRKVFLILMLQLLVTFGIIAAFTMVEPVYRWIQGPGTWFYYVSYGVFIVTYIVLVCIPSVRRSFPGNFIALAIFTLAFAYMCGTISSFYSIEAVMIAAGITAAVCLTLTIFAMQTKIDFTMCSGLLCALVMVLFFFGWACCISWFVSYKTALILQCVYGGLGALVMSLFLCYDIQMLMGGRKYELSPEEYIFAAVQIYLDVVYIFLFILMIFGGGKK